jgi:hypothetical protein
MSPFIPLRFRQSTGPRVFFWIASRVTVYELLFKSQDMGIIRRTITRRTMAGRIHADGIYNKIVK